MSDKLNLYSAIIEKIFFEHFTGPEEIIEWERREITQAAKALNLPTPKNIGDLIYTFRFRQPFPKKIIDTQYDEREWILELNGRSKYKFSLKLNSRIIPREDLIIVDIPDATPEIIRAYALDDEQALLAIVRYNRLIDTFLGLTTYSLQNHLRTTVKGVGQIEIDELYVGLDRHGCHYIIPVQAKGGNDQIGIVQIEQDLKYVSEKFPQMRGRAIAAQFMRDGVIALFELTVQESEAKVVDEKHYRLVPSSELDRESIRNYR